MSSVRFCTNCKAETKYSCLICQTSVCNRPECSLFLPEETPGWKPGACVSSCLPCNERTNTETSKDSKDKEGSKKWKFPLIRNKDTGKRNCLSLKQKVDLIEYAKNHPNKGCRKVAEQFRIGRTQTHKILKNKAEILAQYEKNEQSNRQKRVRTATYEEVNKTLWDWYKLCRGSNIPVSGPVLQEEAILIAEKLGISGFTASNGWLQRFKEHYNLQRMAAAGEDGDVSMTTIESWNERVREITRGWLPTNVWNMDETGSFWKGLPGKSLNEKKERCRGGKKAKERNTWAFFVNAAGEKEDPIVIGKSAKPRCFKNMKDIKRPYGCWYYSNPKAWMKTGIMEEVLKRLNEKMKRQKRSILLFMDNAPCHPESLAEGLSNITVKFLPKNTTSKTQPLDAGIIANWKVKYKKKLLRHVSSKVERGINASEIVKSINVSMAIEWGKQAWDEVLPDVVVKCFKKTNMYPNEVEEEDDPFEGEDELPALQELIDKMGLSADAVRFISEEDDIEVCQGFIDDSDPNWRDELREQIIDDKDVDESESEVMEIEDNDEFDPDLKQPIIKSVTEAEVFAEQLKDYAQFHGHEELSLALSKVSDMFHDIKLSAPKLQTTITEFFS